MTKFLKKASIVTGALLMGSTAFAAGPDFSSLTAGVDFSSAVTAVISIGVALAGLYIAISGSKAVLRMIRG